MLFREEVFGRGRGPPLVVAFFEGADGDVAVLPKPLILNPAGTESQVLINANVTTNYHRLLNGLRGDLLEADFWSGLAAGLRNFFVRGLHGLVQFTPLALREEVRERAESCRRAHPSSRERDAPFLLSLERKGG